MSKDDRNTAIIVAVVLVVCTISLVVIGGYVWRFVSPGLNSTLNSLGIYVKVTTTNYNFTVPKKGTTLASSGNGGSTEPTFQLPDGYTYNFNVPQTSTTNGPSVTGITDLSIVGDARLQSYGNKTIVTQVDGFISIPVISIASPVYSGNTGNELQQGFWVYPKSGNQILLCQRQYFAIGDPRTCWELDKLQLGNEIFVERGGERTRYVVTAINTITHISDFTYSQDNPRDLQIITSTPLDGGQDRLQIIATPEILAQ